MKLPFRPLLSQLKNKTFRSLFLKMNDDHLVATSNHRPILIGLANTISPKRVLEFGGGYGSTPIFSNENIYQDLEDLTVVEDDEEWAEIIREILSENKASTIRVVPEPRDFIAQNDISNYDLIMLDDSKNTTDRRKTIDAALDKASPNAVILIHDFEHRTYRRADFSKHEIFDFNFIKPNIGLLVHKASLKEKKVPIELIFSIYKANIEKSPVDNEVWIELFKTYGNHR